MIDNEFARMIAASTCLESLYLHCLHPEMLEILFSNTPILQSLKKLTVERTLFDLSPQLLANLLSNASLLTCLCLEASSGITEQDATLMAAHPTLTDLDLFSCAMEDTSIERLFASTTIRHLNVAHIEITDWVMPIAALNWTLESLALGSSCLSEEELKKFVITNTSLKKLVLKENCRVGEVLLRSLDQNTSLDTFWCTVSLDKEIRMNCIKHVLENCSNLIYLMID
jgi:hypothetical protein